MDWLRPGIMLYGSTPLADLSAADQALYRVKGAGRAGYAMAADDERETAPALPWPTALAPERIS
ncbi:hypothetical protein IGA98_21085 [Pseudomonas aeruginosa]|nr:hypothetical protein [Pseudomonas aeruginosa]